MTLNDYNTAVAERLLAAITRFEAGTLTLADVHAAVHSAAPLFENDGSGVAEATRLAEADLEEIRFTVLLDEQRPAAVFRLDALRTAIVGAAQPPPS
jgi:hypothetical protein